MASNECNSTLDCLNVGSGVPRVCYEEVSFSDREFFCDCSNWYGWTGDACDNATFLTYYSLAMMTFLTLWTIVLMTLSSRTIYILVKYRSLGTKKNLNPAFYTICLVFLGAVFFATYTLINIPALVDSSRFTVHIYRNLQPGNLEDVAAKGGRIASYSFIMLGNVYLIVSTQIIISWYDVIAKTSAFFPGIFNFSATRVKTGIKIWIVSYCAIITVLLSTDLIVGANVTLIFSACVLFGLYAYGGSHFIKTLKIQKEKGNSQVKGVDLVISSCRTNMINIFALVVLISLNAAFYASTYESSEPGSFNFVVVIKDLIGICALTGLTFDSWYVHKLTKNMLHLTNEHSWLPQVHLVSCFGPRRAPRKTTVDGVETFVSSNEM